MAREGMTLTASGSKRSLPTVATPVAQEGDDAGGRVTGAVPHRGVSWRNRGLADLCQGLRLALLLRTRERWVRSAAATSQELSGLGSLAGTTPRSMSGAIGPARLFQGFKEYNRETRQEELFRRLKKRRSDKPGIGGAAVIA